MVSSQAGLCRAANLPDLPPDPQGMLGSTGTRRLRVTQCSGETCPQSWGWGEEGSHWLLREGLPPPPGGPTLAQPGTRERHCEGSGRRPGPGTRPESRRRPVYTAGSPILTLFFAFCCSTVSLSSVASFSRHHTSTPAPMGLGTDSRSLSGSQACSPHRTCLGAPPCPRRPGTQSLGPSQASSQGTGFRGAWAAPLSPFDRGHQSPTWGQNCLVGRGQGADA